MGRYVLIEEARDEHSEVVRSRTATLLNEQKRRFDPVDPVTHVTEIPLTHVWKRIGLTQNTNDDLSTMMCVRVHPVCVTHISLRSIHRRIATRRFERASRRRGATRMLPVSPNGHILSLPQTDSDSKEYVEQMTPPVKQNNSPPPLSQECSNGKPLQEQQCDSSQRGRPLEL
ncbi:hypothetical protein NECAME_15533 [Necator americanus]|uniref:Uncharacterized protein n=1 Tax=Necator americanus TaxID=51031 RepID=W2SJL8_NECAM|nr:hypothetical protein NECAME_15533 [Necator americanus]ETN69086.1 hypothetical protein NECAME_15533 [Necator americanus]